MNKTILFMLAFLSCTLAKAQKTNGVIGFANCSDSGISGVTGGGANAKIIHVSTHTEFLNAVAGKTPRTVIIDKDITGKGMQDMNDEISLGSNLTILGAGAGKALNGICLDAADQSNIIIRNITLTKGRTDGISFRNCHNVWIDHCDLSDSYDGLLDFTLGSDYMTCSWTKLHNHNKVSITNSGTCHYEDYGKEHVTFAHCWFDKNTQRNPRIGYGKMHIYNCYWTNISSYCIGFHSQAQVLSEYNYFTSSANNPFCNQYSDLLPYRGYLTDNGSYFAKGNPGTSYAHKFTGINYTPKTYYDYEFDQSAVGNVPSETAGIGPKDGIALEPILFPGNGAIQQPSSLALSWGKIDGATNYKVMLGTEKDELSEIYSGTSTTVSPAGLSASTTYYWQVIATVNGVKHNSPIYQFCTAAEQPTVSYPENGAKTAWLRWPSARDKFCTPLPLQWRPAADAKLYKVYIGTSEENMTFAGETSGLSLVPEGIRIIPNGDTYYWRVDAVTKNGNTVKGSVWNFTPAKKVFTEGTNELHDGYLSGIVFAEDFDGFLDGQGVRGDQGPGCIHAVWAGKAGRYAIETETYDQNLGPNLVGVTINDKLVDTWLTNATANDYGCRATRRTVMLQPGDEIRVDFVAGYVNGGLNQSVAHIDNINFTATTQETVSLPATIHYYHAPEATKGYEYEKLPLSEILFKDTLGTIGEYNELQVKDIYSSWIVQESEKYSIYLKNTVRVILLYRDSNGQIAEESYDMDKSKSIIFDAAKESTQGNGSLYAIHLYKILPSPTEYYKPVADTNKDHQLIMTPDYIYIDTNGDKGVAGKAQVKPAYETWIKYTNPSANEVQSKNGNSGIRAFINPTTDKSVSGYIPKGTDGTSNCYCVGTEKYMTYFLKQCSMIKFYYSGTGGAATNLFIEATEAGNTSSAVRVDGEDAAGKNVASETVEMPLDASKIYQVKIMATTGDMLVYAMKLWPGVADGITEITSESASDGLLFNLQGQRITSKRRGVTIINGKKFTL